MQPRARSARKRLTRRSSSEWNEMRGEAAADLEHVPGERQRLVELGELVVDGDPDRLEGPLGGMAAGEARRRRDRGGDRVDQLEGGGERAAAAHDLARDPVGVALLAVLAQHAREAAAVPGVDQLGGGQLLRRVHPHVERRVVGVGEAALARVDLHERHAEVEVDEVGLQALLGQLAQAVLEVGADEARLARDLGGQLGERLLGQRVAVDRDQRARPGRGARRPAARGRRRRACSRRRPGPGCGSSASISSPARTGTCVWGMSRRMAKGCGEVRRSLGEVAVVGLPGRAVPELEAVAGAGDDDLAADRPRAPAGAGSASRGRPSPAPCRSRSRRSMRLQLAGLGRERVQPGQRRLGQRRVGRLRIERDAGVHARARETPCRPGPPGTWPGSSAGSWRRASVRRCRGRPRLMSDAAKECSVDPGWRSGRSPATRDRLRKWNVPHFVPLCNTNIAICPTRLESGHFADAFSTGFQRFRGWDGGWAIGCRAARPVAGRRLHSRLRDLRGRPTLRGALWETLLSRSAALAALSRGRPAGRAAAAAARAARAIPRRPSRPTRCSTPSSSCGPEGSQRDDALDAAGKVLLTDDPEGEIRRLMEQAFAGRGLRLRPRRRAVAWRARRLLGPPHGGQRATSARCCWPRPTPTRRASRSRRRSSAAARPSPSAPTAAATTWSPPTETPAGSSATSWRSGPRPTTSGRSTRPRATRSPRPTSTPTRSTRSRRTGSRTSGSTRRALIELGAGARTRKRRATSGPALGARAARRPAADRRLVRRRRRPAGGRGQGARLEAARAAAGGREHAAAPGAAGRLVGRARRRRRRRVAAHHDRRLRGRARRSRRPPRAAATRPGSTSTATCSTGSATSASSCAARRRATLDGGVVIQPTDEDRAADAFGRIVGAVQIGGEGRARSPWTSPARTRRSSSVDRTRRARS